MKDFKIIFTILVFSFTFSNVKAQTKEETMDWIGEKMEEFLIPFYYNGYTKTNEAVRFINYENGVFTIEKKAEIEGEDRISTIVYDLNYIKKIKFDENGNIEIAEGKNANSVTSVRGTSISNYIYLKGELSFFKFGDIQPRLKKAFEKLIEHNTQKAKPETF